MACYSWMKKWSDKEKWALFPRRLLRHKSNKTKSVWWKRWNNSPATSRSFCPLSFWASEILYTWKEGDGKIRCQVWKRVDATANYPQSETNPRPGGAKEVFLIMWSWRFDIWEERDFKMWMTALINQRSVSNQTSKPSMEKDSGWAGWFTDESGARTKRGQVQDLGGVPH